MLTEKEGQFLAYRLIELRRSFEETKSLKDKRLLDCHLNICVEKFKYIIVTKTSKYKSFHNYEDLNQEGFVALMMGLENYDSSKGSIFWWLHKYIDTRIARNANLHTTIRIPLKKAKLMPPKKEFMIPTMIENNLCPDVELEKIQVIYAIKNVINKLTSEQQEIINMAYGLDGNKPMSVNKICKKIGKTRQKCLSEMNSAFHVMKSNIKI
jgi:RNA polymerase sigma factor (sigma-70 family)